MEGRGKQGSDYHKREENDDFLEGVVPGRAQVDFWVAGNVVF